MNRYREIILLAVLAFVCTFTVTMAVHLDNSGEDPTRDLPLQKPKTVEPAEEPPVNNGVKVLGKFDLTAYCSCEVCCGKWAIDRPLDENGESIVYTASGAVAEAGVTVAVDPDIIPLGTEVYIMGRGWYVAQDTGAFTGDVIDIYFEDHEAAVAFGRQHAVVAIREVAGDA